MRTRDIKLELIARISALRTIESAVERGYQISDICDSLSGSRVSVKQKISTETHSPVPAYDPKKDGDYERFLVVNNID